MARKKKERTILLDGKIGFYYGMPIIVTWLYRPDPPDVRDARNAVHMLRICGRIAQWWLFQRENKRKPMGHIGEYHERTRWRSLLKGR